MIVNVSMATEYIKIECCRINCVIMAYCLIDVSISQTKIRNCMFSENLMPKMPLINPGPLKRQSSSLNH